MTLSYTLFWISFSLLFFCYFGYGILLLLINGIKSVFRKKSRIGTAYELIPATLIITAFNEAAVLEKKIMNTLALDYPAGLLKIIIVTDGSTDASDEIVKRYPSILPLHQNTRKGKFAAIKTAMLQVQTPVVIFSDANTLLNKESVIRMMVHYNDPGVGGVAGEKKILQNHHLSAVGEAEGMYWLYESMMKKLDAGFHTVVGAAGELFSIRTPLFTNAGDDLILDDFVISMRVCLQGYKIEYEPGAFATELPSASLGEEEKRKVRIAAGAYQSIGYLKKCLNLFKHPLLGFQYICRRLLRWIFSPVMLVLMLVSSITLAVHEPGHGFYHWFLYIQLIFYFFAISGGLFLLSGKRAGILAIPFYFLFMNYCLVKGFVKFLRGKQTVLWEKSMRQLVE